MKKGKLLLVMLIPPLYFLKGIFSIIDFTKHSLVIKNFSN